jgi:hyperosmotically inducible protein
VVIKAIVTLCVVNIHRGQNARRALADMATDVFAVASSEESERRFGSNGWKRRRYMRGHIRVGAALFGLAFVLTGVEPALRADAKSSVEEIRKELMQLPYSGVFDFLAFSYDKGTVTLVGYAYHSNLKQDAARAAKRASGVDQVIDKIEELPVLPNDDELRWKTYYAIYRDPFLSRYAPGGGLLWGHRHPVGPDFQAMSFTRFSGMEPIGDYPIHIIVKNGRIALLGVVDTEGDKTLAGLRARDVPGSFGVDNELAVEKSERKSTR